MNASIRRARTRTGMALLLFCAGASAGAPEFSAEERLVIAATKGDVASVNALLESGVNVNYEMRPGLSALNQSVANGSLPVVKALLAAKADPNIGSRSKSLPLYTAASNGRWEMVSALLAAGAKPDYTDSIGMTPLFLAAQSGRQEVVKMLVAAGADPSPRTTVGGGRSALYWVTQGGDLDMALLLVKSGAYPNAATDYQDTPLRLASAGRTSRHLELVRALLAGGADTEAGQVPTDKIENPCVATQAGGECAQVRRSAEGTALGVAVRSGSVEIVEALLAARANVNARQPGRQTPLMIAAGGGPLAVAVSGGNGAAPGMTLTRHNGRADVVRMLLAAGADVRMTDSEGKTALMLASEYGNQDIAQILRNAPVPARN
jgi:ankyrin repeat protein